MLREMQETNHRLANISAKCKSKTDVWRNAPRNARAKTTFGETLREMQEQKRRATNILRKPRESFVVRR